MAAKNPTAEQRRYWTWVVSQGCCVPYCNEPANIHHQIHEKCSPSIEIRQSKNHWQVTPLCKGHHQDAPDSYHKLSKNWSFYKAHGIDLVKEGNRLLDEYRNQE